LTQTKPCSRCRVHPASTDRNAYCKPCRAAYQRAWRARQKGLPPVEDIPALPAEPRRRLRGTPTRAEMLRYRLA
jgi:hypothetical protein